MRPHLPVALVVLVALFATACDPSSPAPTAAAQEAPEPAVASLPADRVVLPVEALAGLRLVYATAEERDISPSLELPAEVVAVPDRRATIGPRVGGRVLSVAVNVGDAVAAGDELVVLESAEVGQTWADLISARARASVARSALRRQRALSHDGVSPQRAVDEAAGALQVAEAEIQAATTRLATFGVSDPGRTPEHAAQVSLTSPISGVVVARAANLGQWVDPSATLVEVVDLDTLWLEASVYERELRFVRVGQAVEVGVRAFPGEVFAGVVGQVADTLDPRARAALVRVALDNLDHRLRPGMFATARVLGTHAHPPRRLLAIPWAAVQEVDGHPAVFVKVGEGDFALHRVHVGERAGALVEVVNGIAAGDAVVADGSFLLRAQLLRGTLGEDD